MHFGNEFSVTVIVVENGISDPTLHSLCVSLRTNALGKDMNQPVFLNCGLILGRQGTLALVRQPAEQKNSTLLKKILAI